MSAIMIKSLIVADRPLLQFSNYAPTSAVGRKQALEIFLKTVVKNVPKSELKMGSE